MPKHSYLIGAYGLFWRMDDVLWFPGNGRTWQLLGRRGTYRGTLRVCDFREARGFYILFDDYGANYVGLARSDHGLGSRLRNHVRDPKKSWSRFCWFSFDDVVAHRSAPGWSIVDRRDAVSQVNAETTVRELEALMIMVLGTRGQNQMRFLAAQQWEQVTLGDCYYGGALTKVDRALLSDFNLRQAMDGK